MAVINSPSSRPRNPWNIIILSIFFVWQFLVAGFGVLIFLLMTFESPASGGTPWGALIRTFINFIVMMSTIVEGTLYSCDRLSVPSYITSQTFKTLYVTSLFTPGLWVIVGSRLSSSWIFFVAPFMGALIYAILVAVRERRNSQPKKEEDETEMGLLDEFEDDRSKDLPAYESSTKL